MLTNNQPLLSVILENNYSSHPPPPYPGFNLVSNQQSQISSSSRNVQSGSIPASSGLLPPHGYGEGRGHYNRKGQTAISSKNQIPLPKSHPNVNSRSRNQR